MIVLIVERKICQIYLVGKRQNLSDDFLEILAFFEGDDEIELLLRKKSV